MDVARFLSAAEAALAGEGADREPRDPAFRAVCDRVEGMTTPNELALLNAAALTMPPEEAYVEVGSFRGRSLCGAVTGVTGKRVVGIENFVEFGMLGEQARTALLGNLADLDPSAGVELIEGDAFDVLLRRPPVVDVPVGVFFYDGEHTRLSHYLALGVIEPLLADEALVLVDDATWPLVQRAHAAFLRRHEGWSVVARWDARHNDDPAWANGLHALAYRRPPGRGRALTRDVRWGLRLQRRVVGPARRAVWRTLHRLPWLVPVAKRLEPTGQHQIG